MVFRYDDLIMVEFGMIWGYPTTKKRKLQMAINGLNPIQFVAYLVVKAMENS